MMGLEVVWCMYIPNAKVDQKYWFVSDAEHDPVVAICVKSLSQPPMRALE